MAKQKFEQYLPLKWLNRFNQSEVVSSLEPECIRAFVEDIYSDETKEKI